jgi:hypothetical protein
MKVCVIGFAFVVGAMLTPSTVIAQCYTAVGGSCLFYNRPVGLDSTCTLYCGPAIVRGKRVTVIQFENGDFRIVSSKGPKR